MPTFTAAFPSDTQADTEFPWVGNKTAKRRQAIAQILWVIVQDFGGEVRDEHGGATVLLQDGLRHRGIKLSRELLNNILLDLRKGYPQIYQRENTPNERGTISHKVIANESMLPPNPFVPRESALAGTKAVPEPLESRDADPTTSLDDVEAEPDSTLPLPALEMSASDKVGVAIHWLSEALIELAALNGGVALQADEERTRAKEELERVIGERDAARKQLAIVLAASQDVSRLLGQEFSPD